MKTIKIDFEGRDEGATFFALYAGLRMYMEQRQKRITNSNEFSVAAGEAFIMLEDLKEEFPEEYAEAEEEFNRVYN